MVTGSFRESVFLLLLLAVTVCGCSSSAQPTAPSTPTTGQPPRASQAQSVSGIVIEPSGACIYGATVEVIAGQAVGQKTVQVGACDHWWPFDGFAFPNLTPGIQMTLRASAAGFGAAEVTANPGQWDVEITLKPVPSQ